MRTIDIGNTAELKRVFTEDDVNQFAKLSTDMNPIHIDPEYAKTTIFEQNIVHGSLVASLFSALLANKLPGNGTIYLSQSLSFKAPCFLNDELTASVTVTSKREGKPIYTLLTVCRNSNGTVILDGEAVVMFKL